jgi:Zn-dependent protease with chaperone function
MPVKNNLLNALKLAKDSLLSTKDIILIINEFLFIIIDGIRLFIADIIGRLYFRFLKKSSSRLWFNYSLLVGMIILLVSHGIQSVMTNITEIVGLCFAVIALILIILFLILRRYQSHIIKNLDAELATENNFAELLEMVCDYSQKAKIPKPAVYVTNKPYITALSDNAIRNNLIILNSNIFAIVDRKELECVIAHEIRHIKHHHSMLNKIFLVFPYLIFYCLWEISLAPINVVRESVMGLKSSYKWYERQLYLFVPLSAIIVVPAFLLSIIIGIPIRNIFCEQELQADLWSSCTTGNPKALKNAIFKLLTFVKPLENCSFGFDGMFVNAEPPSCKWVSLKMFRFLYPENRCRMNRLDMLDEMNIVPQTPTVLPS